MGISGSLNTRSGDDGGCPGLFDGLSSFLFVLLPGGLTVCCFALPVFRSRTLSWSSVLDQMQDRENKGGYG